MVRPLPRLPRGGGLTDADDGLCPGHPPPRPRLGPQRARGLERLSSGRGADRGPARRRRALLPLAADAAMRPPVALLVYAPDEPRLATFYPLRRVLARSGSRCAGRSRTGRPCASSTWPRASSSRWRRRRSSGSRPMRGRSRGRRWPARRGREPDGRPGDRGRRPATTDDPPRRTAPRDRGRRGRRRADGGTTLIESGARDPGRPVRRGDARRWPPSARAPARVRRRAARGSARGPRCAARSGPRGRKASQRIAVVCGAWHAPALEALPTAAEDDRLLRGLPRPMKTAAAWVPWTYERLATASGYGAGVASPGWYAHLWSDRDERIGRQLDAAASPPSAARRTSTPRRPTSSRRSAWPRRSAAMRGPADPGARPSSTTRCAPALASATRPAAGAGPPTVSSSGARWARPRPTPPSRRSPPTSSARLADSGCASRPARSPSTWTCARTTTSPAATCCTGWACSASHGGTPSGPAARAARSTSSGRWPGSPSTPSTSSWPAGTATRSPRPPAPGRWRPPREADDLARLTALVEAVLLADLAAAVRGGGRRSRGESRRSAPTCGPDGGVAAARPGAALRQRAVAPTTGAVSARRRRARARICVGLPTACVVAGRRRGDALSPGCWTACTARSPSSSDPDRPRRRGAAALLRVADLPTASTGWSPAARCACCSTRGVIDSAEATEAGCGSRSRRARSPRRRGAWLEGFLRESGTILLHDEDLFAALDAWVAECSRRRRSRSRCRSCAGRSPASRRPSAGRSASARRAGGLGRPGLARRRGRSTRPARGARAAGPRPHPRHGGGGPTGERPPVMSDAERRAPASVAARARRRRPCARGPVPAGRR